MKRELNRFERILFEAPDDPPDLSAEAPPDLPSDDPPDLAADDPGGGDMGDAPPDLGEDFGDETGGFDDASPEGEEAEGEESLELDEKISAVMNQNLYQRFLALLNSIGNQLSMMKNNSDVLYTLSNDSLDIIGGLKKLDENVRLYLMNTFINENYSKNLLFFNKCLNLLKLLNDIFEKKIQKGIRGME